MNNLLPRLYQIQCGQPARQDATRAENRGYCENMWAEEEVAAALNHCDLCRNSKNCKTPSHLKCRIHLQKYFFRKQGLLFETKKCLWMQSWNHCILLLKFLKKSTLPPLPFNSPEFEHFEENVKMKSVAKEYKACKDSTQQPSKRRRHSGNQ